MNNENKEKKRFNRKKIATIATAAGLTLGLAGAAFAYFTSSGNGTGSATVGSPSNWSVVQASSTGTLYPCGATPSAAGCTSVEGTITYTVTNNGSGNQLLTYANLQTAIDHDSSTPANIMTGGTNSQPNASTFSTSNLSGATAVTGCTASWFGSSVVTLNGATSNVDVAANGTATVVVNVGMENASANQNACHASTPDVDLWVS